MTTPPSDQTPGRIAMLIRRVTRGREGVPTSLADLRGSETAKAAGLAGAMIVNNVIALGSTVVFARLLKDNQGGGYGSLAALVSYFLILSVVGQALQVATAREGVLGHLGTGAGLAATVRQWSRSMAVFTVAITIVSVLLRHPIADAVGVKHNAWAAALGLPAAGLWLELSILRGVLQGLGDYQAVGFSLIGEQGARLVMGAILAAVGLGVTGAYLGTPLSFIAMCLYCAWRLQRHVQATAGAQGAAGTASAEGAEAPVAALSLVAHVKRAWAPIAGLIVIAVLQNIDIIAAKHRFSTSMASSYGATAVAAKVLIWVAMGAGFYLVPEVSRRRASGEDPRPILARALGIIAVCCVPVLLIFAFASHPLIVAAFGASKSHASGSLLVLGLAFTVLACTYLAIQYLLALRRTWFLVALALVAIAEPILLLNASRKPTGFAAVVLAIQAVGAIVAFSFALRRGPASPAPPGEPGPQTTDIEPIPEVVG
jgi:O-antigen/teichoic acid export membrane protein